jgi:hypothetical protein
MDARKAKKSASIKEIRGGFKLIHRFPVSYHFGISKLIHY